MSTKKPRITVTLEPRVYEVLRSISVNSGGTMSAFIGSLLSENLPVFERMAVAFQRIAEHQSNQKRQIAEGLGDAEAALAPLLEKALSQFDFFIANIEDAVGAGAATVVGAEATNAVAVHAPKARKIAPKKGALTPPSNRGVRFTDETPKKVEKSSTSEGQPVKKRIPKNRPKKEGVE